MKLATLSLLAATLLTQACGDDGGSAAQDGGGDDGGSASDAARAIDASVQPDAARPSPDAGTPASCAFTKDSMGFFQLHPSATAFYDVHLPADYDVLHPTPRALLVAIHGCGDDAHNFDTWAAVPGTLRATHSYIAISLGGRDGACWMVPQDGALVQQAIDHASSCFAVNPKKVVLAGYSSGGILAYDYGLKHAAAFAGILIENSGISGNVDALIAGAAWKLNIAHIAHTDDGDFAIAGVKANIAKLRAAGFPVAFQEDPGTHDGTFLDWQNYLLPKLTPWVAP